MSTKPNYSTKSIKLGVIIGIALSLLKLRKLLYKYSNNSNVQRNPKETLSKAQKIRIVSIALFKYFIRFPLFTYILSITLKTINQPSSPIKYSSSITFLTTLILHRIFNIFNNEWSLYLLCRTLHSFAQYIIPPDLQPHPLYVYPFFHTICAIPITFFVKYSSNKLWYLFEKSIDENRQKWTNLLDHKHSSMAPNCGLFIHGSYPHSCLKGTIYKFDCDSH